jgi:hypothetical protein
LRYVFVKGGAVCALIQISSPQFCANLKQYYYSDFIQFIIQ